MSSLVRSGLRGCVTRAVVLLFAVSGLTVAISQQATEPVEDYEDFWKRGEYAQALKMIEEMINSTDAFVPVRLSLDHGELLFAVGRVDEAIAAMEDVANRYPEPANTLELALMHQYRGHTDQYEQKLRYAASQARPYMWRYSRRDDNYVAMGRIAELLGENPRTILNTHFKVLLEQNPGMTKAHIGAGDLAYRNAGYDIAAGHYEKALEQEPENQDALAGLAECFWQSHDERLGATLQKLLDLNSHHPRAKALQVEQRLDSADADEALKTIEEALAINPVSLRFRSLKAAALFLKRETAAMQALQQEVLEFNPICSEVYRVPGRIASRHYLFEEGSALQKAALELDPNDHDARALYTLDLMRLGREFEGQAEAEIAFAADPFNVQLYNLLQLMETVDGFSVRENGEFILKLPKNEEPLIADDASRMLAYAIEHLQKKYEVEIEKPVLVEMFDKHDDFMVRSVGLPGNVGHLGICFGKLVTMDSPSARPRGSWNWRTVLWHEFMHVISLQKTKNKMPRWLSEGISVYEEGQYSPAWRNRLDPDYRAVLAEGDPPKVHQIGKYFTEPKSAMHLLFGYFVAGEFAQFYVDNYGMPAMNGALSRIGEGTEAVAALALETGGTEQEMEGAFEAKIEERLAILDNLPKPKEPEKPGILDSIKKFFGGDKDDPASGTPAPSVAVASPEMPSSPLTDAIREAQAAAEKKDWAAAAAAYRKAVDLFPDLEGNGTPLKLLAEVYKSAGNDEEYRRALYEVLHSGGAELGAAHELIALNKEEKNYEETAKVADWALGIDPYDESLHETLSDALISAGREREALAPLAVLAHLDTARANEYLLKRAQIFAGLNEPAEAKTEVLKVLEATPHYWLAQSLLLDLVEGKVNAEAGPVPQPSEPHVE